MCVMHYPQMGLGRQPKGDPEGQPKKPQKDCPRNPETAPIETPKRSQNDLEMDLAKFTPKAPWSVHPLDSPPNRLQTLPFAKDSQSGFRDQIHGLDSKQCGFRARIHSLDSEHGFQTWTPSLDSELQFKDWNQSLDSGPRFMAWIQGWNATEFVCVL